ncbi:GntR family transcriptional regulator [Nocardia alni]|uniref:GntR family transcriptional regulator n=1 Tax=Nocardia alni TaxID=2815723 RepID=UPI001C2292A3|nr:GntR family transcriptional regulator [Nocardia alni]
MSTEFVPLNLPDFADPRKLSQADLAYRNLRSAIVGWQVEPGAWVTEAGLQELSNLGRTPTREAANRLVAIKMLHGIPRNGYQVATVTVDDAARLYDVWESLAPMVGRALGGHVHPRIAELVRGLADDPGEHDNPLLVTELVFDELIRATGNRWLGTIAAPLFGHLQRLWILTLRLADKDSIASAWATMLLSFDSEEAVAESAFVDFTRQSRALTLESVGQYLREHDELNSIWQ